MVEFDVPKDVIEDLSRMFLPEIQAFYASDEGKEYFAKWTAEQEKTKKSAR